MIIAFNIHRVAITIGSSTVNTENCESRIVACSVAGLDGSDRICLRVSNCRPIDEERRLFRARNIDRPNAADALGRLYSAPRTAIGTKPLFALKTFRSVQVRSGRVA
jgi:hypothetical protein